MNKIKFTLSCFFIIVMLFSNGYAAEIKPHFEYYIVSETEFDELLESSKDSEKVLNESNLRICDDDDDMIIVSNNWVVPEKIIDSLSDSVYTTEILSDLIGDKAIDYKFIYPNMNPCYKMPFVVQVYTDDEVKYVTFEPDFNNNGINFLETYHAEVYNIDEFKDQFEKKQASVYINDKLTDGIYACIRNNGALLDFETTMQAAGLSVEKLEGEDSFILKSVNVNHEWDQGMQIDVVFDNSNSSIKIVRLWDDVDATELMQIFSGSTSCEYTDGKLLLNNYQIATLLQSFTEYEDIEDCDVIVSNNDNAVYVKRINSIPVYLDGVRLSFEKSPIIENDRPLVPMRAIFEALEAEVTWDNDTNTAIAVKDGTTISITIDSDVMYKNGEAIQLDAPARLIDDGYTFVPLRAVSVALDCDVQWDEDLHRVDITTK